MTTKRPIPHSLSQWDSCTEVLYKCPTCGYDFRILGPKHTKFCNWCGQKLDWSKSVRYCSQVFKKKYENLLYTEHKTIRSPEVIHLLFELFNNKYSEGAKYVCEDNE